MKLTLDQLERLSKTFPELTEERLDEALENIMTYLTKSVVALLTTGSPRDLTQDTQVMKAFTAFTDPQLIIPLIYLAKRRMLEERSAKAARDLVEGLGKKGE